MNNRIIVISQVPPPVHGSTVITTILLETLRDLSIDVSFVDKRFSSTVGMVGKPSLLKLLKVVPLCARLIASMVPKRANAAILFLTNRPASFLVDFILVELLALTRIPVIAYIHTLGFERLSARGKLFAWLVQRIFRRLAYVVVLSHKLTSDIPADVPRANIRVIPNTVDRPPLSIRLSRTSRTALADTPVVLFVSNLIPEKGADAFVEAAIPIAVESSAVFEIYGAATDACYVELLEDRIAAAGVELQVRVMGSLSASEKWDVLSRASVLAFPSKYQYEAQPLVLIEALAVGLPVAAFDVGAVSDMVVHDRTGLIIEPASPLSLRNSLIEMLSTPELLDEMSERCVAHYEENFSRKAYALSWQKMLSSVSGVS